MIYNIMILSLMFFSSTIFCSDGDVERQSRQLMNRFSDCEESIRDSRQRATQGSLGNKILLVGTAGSGKTTLLHFIAEKPVFQRTIEIRENISSATSIPDIYSAEGGQIARDTVWDVRERDLLPGSVLGHDVGRPGTVVPVPFISPVTTVWDIPGLNDSGGPVTDLINAYLVKRIVDDCEGNLRILITVNYNMCKVENNRGLEALKAINKIASSFEWQPSKRTRFGVAVTRGPSSSHAGYYALRSIFAGFESNAEWENRPGISFLREVVNGHIPVFSITSSSTIDPSTPITFSDRDRLLEWTRNNTTTCASLSYTPSFSAEERAIMGVMQRNLIDVKDDLGELLSVIQQQYDNFSFFGQYFAGWDAHRYKNTFVDSINRGYLAFQEGTNTRPFHEYMQSVDLILDEHRLGIIFARGPNTRSHFDRIARRIMDRDQAHEFLRIIGADHLIDGAKLPKIFREFGNSSIDLIEQIRVAHSISSIFSRENIDTLVTIVNGFKEVVRAIR